VAEDMDGKVLTQVFERPHRSNTSRVGRSAGADGRHPPHARFEPVAAHEAMEQMIAWLYRAAEQE